MTKLKKTIANTLLIAVFLYSSYEIGLAFSVFHSTLIGSVFGVWLMGVLIGFVAIIICGIIDWLKKGEKK